MHSAGGVEDGVSTKGSRFGIALTNHGDTRIVKVATVRGMHNAESKRRTDWNSLSVSVKLVAG